MIDSHQHFWQFTEKSFPWISCDMPELRHDFLLPELENELDLSGVDQVISVQARSCESENSFLLEQAKASNGLVTAVIGWAPLTSPKLRPFLDQYLHEPLFKGVREIISFTPTEQFLDNPDFDLGIRELTHRGLTYDLLISADQLTSATAFVDRHPNQRIVLNHCANPEIHPEGFSHESAQAWARNIRELARRPHIYCKLSGLHPIQNNSTWNTDLIRPFFDTILNAFGPQRIMFASDWPTCLHHTTYPIWLNTVDNLILPLSSEEKRAIQHSTVTDFYQLSQ